MRISVLSNRLSRGFSLKFIAHFLAHSVFAPFNSLISNRNRSRSLLKILVSVVQATAQQLATSAPCEARGEQKGLRLFEFFRPEQRVFII